MTKIGAKERALREAREAQVVTVGHRSTDIADYQPLDGLKALAAAEIAEKYFERAKNADGLYAAVEAKLSEQRRFVLWWDAQEKARGGWPTEGEILASQTGDAKMVAGEDGIPDRRVIHRWRTRLKDAEKFESALESAQERCRRVCEAEKGGTEQKGASGTGENEWFTPVEFLEAARDVLGGFDLDPASSEQANETVKAAEFFTLETDGLSRDWHGRVWLNPPYAQPAVAEFIAKLVEEYNAGHVEAAILLTHNYTDTAWFHLLAGAATAICFTRGRVKFESPTGDVAAPTQGQAFSYFGTDVEAFAVRFANIGFVVRPV